MFQNQVTDNVINEIISNLAIQRYFHLIFTESLCNAYSLLLGSYLITIRLFKHKKGKDPNDTPTLCMRSCAEFGSIIGTQMHLYRIGTASLLSCTEANCWDNIFKEIDNSRLCHVLSPLIKRVKNMHSQKLNVRNKQLKPNGDIVIDNFYFHKSQWSILIPRVCEKFELLFGKLLSGHSWKDITNVNNPIQVTQMIDREVFDEELILHYKFFTNIEGKVTTEEDCILQSTIDNQDIEKLGALVMISLHAL